MRMTPLTKILNLLEIRRPKFEDSSLSGILSAGERNELWFMLTFKDIIWRCISSFYAQPDAIEVSAAGTSW